MTDEEKQLYAQVTALRLVVTMLLADRFEDNFDPKDAGERFNNSVFAGLSRSSSEVSMRVSEEIASISHEAVRIAMMRGLRRQT